MNQLSIVIITRNEENNIANCIRSVQPLSNDIIIVDAGSDDDTIELAKQAGARTFSIEWQGYGYSRNFGAAKAKNDWILALDADERVSTELINAIEQINLAIPENIYRFHRKNYIGNRQIRFGTMGLDKVTRIYNRNHCSWDLSIVHEKLESKTNQRIKLKGYVSHYAFKSLEDYHTKAIQYAEMSAEKYFAEGRKASFIKRFFSPVFNSVKSYVFHLGFLEGRNGISIARTIAYYTWLKYDHLSKMTQPVAKIESTTRISRTLNTISSEQ